MSISGVSGAVAMDHEGFAIEWSGEMGGDAEGMAALTSSLCESARGVGRELGQGAVRNMLCEFDKGLVLVMDAGSTTRVVVLLRDPTALDAVRRCAAQVMSSLPDDAMHGVSPCR